MDWFGIIVALLFSSGVTTRATASYPGVAQKIINGRSANPGTVTSIVQLSYDGNPKCGGSIVNSEWILTAAHCVGCERIEGLLVEAKHYSIIAGEYDLFENEGTEQLRTVSRIVCHDYENATFDNDIALLKLGTPLIFGEYVQAATLTGSTPSPGEDVVISGWGYTISDGLPAPILKTATIKAISLEECRGIYGSSRILNGMFCAVGVEGEDACLGDSGGPLYTVSGVLAGIISFGVPDCGEPGMPGVYTDVAKYASWIREHTSNHNHKNKKDQKNAWKLLFEIFFRGIK